MVWQKEKYIMSPNIFLYRVSGYLIQCYAGVIIRTMRCNQNAMYQPDCIWSLLDHIVISSQLKGSLINMLACSYVQTLNVLTEACAHPLSSFLLWSIFGPLQQAMLALLAKWEKSSPWIPLTVSISCPNLCWQGSQLPLPHFHIKISSQFLKNGDN